MQFWTNIATLATAVAALFAILEMRWQRKSSYQPDLIVAGFPFRIRKFTQPTSQLELITDTATFTTNVGMAASPAHVRCLNVGVGHAKRVTFRWSFDASRIVEAIAELDVQRAAAIVIEDQAVHFGAPDLPVARASHYLLHQLRATTPALAPGDTAGAGVAIPFVYSTLLGEYFAALAASPETGSKFALAIEPLHLSVEYLDIGNGTHRKNFVVVPNMVAVMSLRTEHQEAQECDIAHGYFEVSEA